MKPKAFVDNRMLAIESLKTMLDGHAELYDRCISTPGFGYHFNQLANKAIHYDHIIERIAPRYPEMPDSDMESGK